MDKHPSRWWSIWELTFSITQCGTNILTSLLKQDLCFPPLKLECSQNQRTLVLCACESSIQRFNMSVFFRVLIVLQRNSSQGSGWVKEWLLALSSWSTKHTSSAHKMLCKRTCPCCNGKQCTWTYFKVNKLVISPNSTWTSSHKKTSNLLT